MVVEGGEGGLGGVRDNWERGNFIVIASSGSVRVCVRVRVRVRGDKEKE